MQLCRAAFKLVKDFRYVVSTYNHVPRLDFRANLSVVMHDSVIGHMAIDRYRLIIVRGSRSYARNYAGLGYIVSHVVHKHRFYLLNRKE